MTVEQEIIPEPGPDTVNPAEAIALAEQISAEALQTAEKLAGSLAGPSDAGEEDAEELGNLDERLLSWFNAEHFVDPEFDADKYVGDLRRYVRAPQRQRIHCIALQKSFTGAHGASVCNLLDPPVVQVPLDTLKTELDKHLAFLKNRLVEVINEDYNDFVSLSTKLVNVDGVVLRMKKPLCELRVRSCRPITL